MDYRGIFLYENSSVFRAEEFIFMVNFDEIEFLESEIVDDDPTAPVGTLVHITEDGKVESVEQKQDVQVVESDVQNETRQGEAKEVVEVDNSDNEQNEMAQTVTTDVQDEPQADETAKSEETVTETSQPEETVTETSQPEAVEQAEEVEETTDVSTEETLQVADESEEPVETANEIVDETAIETTEEAQEVTPQAETAEEAQNVEDAFEEPAPVEDNAAVENAVVEESAQESQNVEAAQDEKPEEQKTVQKAKKPRKPAQKKEAAPVVVNDEEHKTSLNLHNGKSINDELFGTSFEIEQPAKAKIVSTKKKQEKAEDLWAVAAVANPKKETAPVKEEAKVEAKPVKTAAKKATTKTAESAPKAENEDVKPAPKKTASKKSTKVENINTSTEEKKVAKTTKEVATEEKPVKASKATKEVPVKEAPVKEEKAQKAETKTVKDDETVIVEGEGKTHGKYVIKKTDKGNFVFKLYSSNYRVVAIGAQAYTTLGAAKIGIQSIINNAEKAPVENQTLKKYEVEKFPKWEIYQDKKGEYRLRLFATNGNLIATTNDGYADITGAKNGIAAVARANKGCAIVRNDNLW